MQLTTQTLEQTRADVVETEQRIVRQRRRVEKLLVERNTADEAQAQLLIMEQSLISMTRYLKSLERDLLVNDTLGGQKAPAAPRRAGAQANGSAQSNGSI